MKNLIDWEFPERMSVANSCLLRIGREKEEHNLRVVATVSLWL